MPKVITDNLDLWSSALLTRSTAGRGSNGKLEAYGIKKLRELILELAVRGKLVPQDPNDEPASVLLKRIQVEKAKLVTEGNIKKDKPLLPITDDERPFGLPKSWEWVRLGDISSAVQYGFTDSANHQTRDVLFLRITDIQDDAVNWATVPGCGISMSESDGYALENNDLVIARTGGTIGKSYLVTGLDQKAVFASYLIRIGNLSSTSAEYKKVFLGSVLYWRQLIASSMGTGQPNVNGTALKNLIFSLPPLEEQHRIVAKVDELMALCDQLEQQQTHSIEAHQTLVVSLLGTLTRVESQQEFSVAWARIASHFDTLFTTEASIDQLKQTILQLAVMGKLVPQDDNDEPAEALYARIQRTKGELVKDGTIKRTSIEPNPTEDECNSLPTGWIWSRLGAVFDVRDGTHDTPKYTDEGFPLITSKNIYTGSLSFESAKFISEKDHRQISERSRVDRGDILFAMIGSIGNPVIVDTDREFSIKNVALFKYYGTSDAEPRFLLLYLNLVAEAMREKSAGGVQSFVSLGFLRNYPFPLPPLSEQHRIVAKLDELMALCDTLKARLADAQIIQLHLADAIVEQAVA